MSEMETKKNRKKTYEIFFVVEIALRAISTTFGRVDGGKWSGFRVEIVDHID